MCLKDLKLLANYLLTLCLVVIIGWSQVLWAEDEPSLFETQASLEQAIRDYLEPQLTASAGSRFELDINNIDPRLRLGKCQAPLDLTPLGRSELRGKVNIKITCVSPSWGIFIPVQINSFEPVVISLVSLPRDSVISANILGLREMETSALNYTFFRSVDQVVGTTTTRSVQANSVIFTNMVKAADAVRNGDNVVIKATAGSLTVRIKGQALQDGAIGEQIQVRNTQSRRIIRAIVIAPGQVEVPM